MKTYKLISETRDCPFHPGIETTFNWSDFFQDFVPSRCAKCKEEIVTSAKGNSNRPSTKECLEALRELYKE